jgi:hypothetical protein
MQGISMQAHLLLLARLAILCASPPPAGVAGLACPEGSVASRYPLSAPSTHAACCAGFCRREKVAQGLIR